MINEIHMLIPYAVQSIIKSFLNFCTILEFAIFLRNVAEGAATATHVLLGEKFTI